MWDTAESWWNTASDGIKDWWNNGGREVVIADASGAGVGVLEGTLVAISTAGAGWGAIPANAVKHGVYFSTAATITLWMVMD